MYPCIGPDDGYLIAETCCPRWRLYGNNIYFVVLTYLLSIFYIVNESCTELLLDDRGSILGVPRELAFCYHFWALVPTQRSVQYLPGTIFLGVEAVGAWMWTTHVLPKSGIWVYFRVCPLSASAGRWISQVELCASYSESYWINSPTLFIK